MNDHAVILYGNDAAALSHCVVPFIAPGLQDGGAAVVVATGQHERAFRSDLAAIGIDPASDAVRDRLILLNAHDTLKGMVLDGEIDAARFEHLVGKVIRKLSRRYTVHAYGEMVGILRASARADTAARLEQLWSKLLSDVPFELLCGYPIDVLGSEFQPGEMGLILTSHTKLVSTLADFEASLRAGIETTVGMQRAVTIRGMIEATKRPGWAALPKTESTLLWLREHLPDHVGEIVDRAKAHYEQ